MSRVLIAIVLVALMGSDAGAENPCPDPGCHLKNGGELTTPKGTVLTLPPGYFLDEPTWAQRDLELKDAQNQVTRLKAENESFRKDAKKSSSPWLTILGTAVSVAGTVLIYSLVK